MGSNEHSDEHSSDDDAGDGAGGAASRPRRTRAKQPPAPEGPEALQAALEACLRLLRARARSSQELALALERRGYSALTQGEALERLRGWGYLDDARFARERAASLLGPGRLGPRAVLERLAAHGVDDAAARAAVGAASEAVDFEPLEAARRVLQKRRLLPPSPEAPSAVLTPKEQARAARLLLGRGFSEEVVSALLGQAALDPPDPSD